MISLPRLIRNAIRSWTQWRSDKRLSRAIPQMNDLKQQREKAIRSHRKTSHIERRQRQLMLQALKGE